MVVNRRQFMARAAAPAAMSLAMSNRSVAVAAPPSQVRVVPVDDERQFAGVRALFERDHPGLQLTTLQVNGEQALRSEHGGMRVFRIYRGQGEVFLPRGYRTQEGDGKPLPEDYRPEKLGASFADTIAVLKEGLKSVAPPADVPVSAIVGRWKGDVFVGDFA